MVTLEFSNLVGQFKLITYVGVDDFADKLNFLFSVIILFSSMIVVTIKSYFFVPLSCYAAPDYRSSKFDQHAETQCWIHGIIALLPGEKLPRYDEEFKFAYNTKRITYYQWVPFVLGLQCFLFYVPRVILKLIWHNKFGNDLERLAKDSKNAINDPQEERKRKVERIARTIEYMLFQHRGFRPGEIEEVRRKPYGIYNLSVFFKRIGTWLILYYLLMKMLYGLNVIGQLFLMKRFLGFNESIASVGNTISSNMFSFVQLRKFSRSTYCYFPFQNRTATREYWAQCTLPVTLLNEKIFVFLWFWISMVGIITAISIPVWFLRLAFMSRRVEFIKKYLQIQESYDRSDKQLMNVFIDEFLRYDGVFLMRMISINAGDIITADMVNRLWQIYKENNKNMDPSNIELVPEQ